MRFAIALLALPVFFAQQPQVTNARLETHALAGRLDAEIRKITGAAASPEWAGYTVPMIPGNHGMCYSNGDIRTATAVGPVKLEGPGTMVVLFRIASHAIDNIRTYSIDCELDVGGLPFHLLTGVTPGDSVNYLSLIAAEHHQAVMAIAMHGDPAADGALERLSAPTQPDKVRQDVAFWLGSARGRRGVEILKQMRDRDSSEAVREKIMFAFSVSKDPEAGTLLIDSAKNDRSPKIRSKALFWLAQKAGQKETSAITRAITDDPDTHVKKQAVFALQQLPRDEGIPLLIQVARTNANPEVRKQAMFWLGQSNDARAVKFFEEMLTK